MKQNGKVDEGLEEDPKCTGDCGRKRKAAEGGHVAAVQRGNNPVMLRVTGLRGDRLSAIYAGDFFSFSFCP